MKSKDSCATFARAVQFAVSCKLVMVLVCESTRKFSLTVSGVLLQTSNQFCGGESVLCPSSISSLSCAPGFASRKGHNYAIVPRL